MTQNSKPNLWNIPDQQSFPITGVTGHGGRITNIRAHLKEERLYLCSGPSKVRIDASGL